SLSSDTKDKPFLFRRKLLRNDLTHGSAQKRQATYGTHKTYSIYKAHAVRRSFSFLCSKSNSHLIQQSSPKVHSESPSNRATLLAIDSDQTRRTKRRQPPLETMRVTKTEGRIL